MDGSVADDALTTLAGCVCNAVRRRRFDGDSSCALCDAAAPATAAAASPLASLVVTSASSAATSSRFVASLATSSSMSCCCCASERCRARSSASAMVCVLFCSRALRGYGRLSSVGWRPRVPVHLGHPPSHPPLLRPTSPPTRDASVRGQSILPWCGAAPLRWRRAFAAALLAAHPAPPGALLAST